MTHKTRQHKSVQAKPHIREKNLNPQHDLSHRGRTGPPRSRGPRVASSQAPINSHSPPRTLLFFNTLRDLQLARHPKDGWGRRVMLWHLPGVGQMRGRRMESIKQGKQEGLWILAPAPSISLVTWTKPLPPAKSL